MTRSPDETCTATCKDGSPCRAYPVEGQDRCRMHLGTSPDGDSHAGNQFAARHHLQSDPANVLDDLAETDTDAYNWVLGKLDSYSESAPFPVYEVAPEDRDDPDALRAALTAKGDAVLQVCVREYIIWKATGFQLKGGVVTRTGGEGGLADRVDENPVNLPLDRMERTVTKRLKELGVLEDPESARAAAETDRVDALRDLMDTIDDRNGREDRE